MKNENKESKLRKLLGPVVNGIFTLGGIALFYGIVAAPKGSWNYKKWPEIQNQRELKQELINQNYYRKQFQEIDKNKDYVIDSTEFIYR